MIFISNLFVFVDRGLSICFSSAAFASPSFLVLVLSDMLFASLHSLCVSTTIMGVEAAQSKWRGRFIKGKSVEVRSPPTMQNSIALIVVVRWGRTIWLLLWSWVIVETIISLWCFVVQVISITTHSIINNLLPTHWLFIAWVSPVTIVVAEDINVSCKAGIVWPNSIMDRKLSWGTSSHHNHFLPTTFLTSSSWGWSLQLSDGQVEMVYNLGREQFLLL